MGKYLKLFNYHNEYDEFITSENVNVPNVSHCIEENEVHYAKKTFDNVVVYDIGIIMSNSEFVWTENSSMNYIYVNSTYAYGTTYTNNNPIFKFDGFQQNIPYDYESLSGNTYYERYVTDEITCSGGSASSIHVSKSYVYRNPNTNEWFFYCDGERGGTIYWAWIFSDGEASSFTEKYLINPSQISTNVIIDESQMPLDS